MAGNINKKNTPEDYTTDADGNPPVSYPNTVPFQFTIDNVAQPPQHPQLINNILINFYVPPNTGQLYGTDEVGYLNASDAVNGVSFDISANPTDDSGALPVDGTTMSISLDEN